MLTTFIAVYGGLLSTFLAVLKFREIWQDRFRLNTLLTSGQDIQVHITNLYHKPDTIINYELFWAKNRSLEDGHKSIDTGSEDCCNIAIAAAETTVVILATVIHLSFRSNHDNWLNLKAPNFSFPVNIGTFAHVIFLFFTENRSE
ncbi:MAG: hypothetical protein V4592_05455 [Bacteroidota bacterium]